MRASISTPVLPVHSTLRNGGSETQTVGHEKKVPRKQNGTGRPVHCSFQAVLLFHPVTLSVREKPCLEDPYVQRKKSTLKKSKRNCPLIPTKLEITSLGQFWRMGGFRGCIYCISLPPRGGEEGVKGSASKPHLARKFGFKRFQFILFQTTRSISPTTVFPLCSL